MRPRLRAPSPDQPSRPRRSAAGRSLLRPALILLGLLLLGADGRPPPSVIAAEVVLIDFPVVIEALGTARANESVDIRPATSERIVDIRFDEGEPVEAGRVLVQLESSEARADVASARATLAESDAQLRRARDLYETRAVSESELDQRRMRRDADRAALDASEARLANTTIRAPFAGQLGLRRVSLGSFVDPSTIITTLDDTDPIKLDFAVPATVLSRVELGMRVSARSAAWPGEPFEGRVDSIDTRVDPVSRTLTVRALIPNDRGRLRAGMFLTVELVHGEARALVVPEQAIVPERSQQFVWVIGEDNVAERREVKTGRRRPGLVELLRGVAAGERVIAEGTQKARDGRPVEVIDTIVVALPATKDGATMEETRP